MPGGIDCMTCSPGLLTAFGNGEAPGKIVFILESIFEFDLVGITGTDDLLEFLFKIPADDENHPVEARTHGIVNRIIHDCFT